MAESQVNEVALKYMVDDKAVEQSNRYKAYPEYKDSGVEWLGEIPSGWKFSKLKRTCNVKGGYAFKSELFSDSGIPVIRIGDIHRDGSIDLSGCKYIPIVSSLVHKEYSITNGQILMAMTGATIGKAGRYYNLEPALINQRVGKFELNNQNILYSFLWYILQTDIYRNYITLTAFGGAQPNISDVEMVDIHVTIPTKEEQESIANFLDYETAKIDTLIEKQQRLIKLLTEKRQAVISHAVTKGLNPDVPMKDSGVEWLGKVPAHWEVGRLKNVLRIRNGRDYKAVEVESGGYPVYGSGGVFRRSSKYLFDGESVLFGRKGTIDKPLLVSGKFWTVDTMFYSEAFKNAKPEYIHHQAILFPFDMLSTNTALPSMTQEDLLELGFVVPPLSEQVDICQYLKTKLETFSELTSKAQQAIQLMQERRTALISAAVTGKIDVRDWEMYN